MDTLIAIPYLSIPDLLSHYTKPENFQSILSNSGKNQEICFWANSNISKNDANELKYGKEIYDGVKDYLKSKNKSNYLSEFSNERGSFSISFTEESSSLYMIKNYGNLRLDFDLNNIYNKRELQCCEYITKEEIYDYTKLLINEFENLFNEMNVFKTTDSHDGNQLVSLVVKQASLDRSVREKIYLIKEKNEWEEEKEWRKIYYPDDNHPVLYRGNGIPYLKVYLPIACLKKVTLFDVDSINPELSSYQYKSEFENYIHQMNWNIPVVVSTFKE